MKFAIVSQTEWKNQLLLRRLLGPLVLVLKWDFQSQSKRMSRLTSVISRKRGCAIRCQTLYLVEGICFFYWEDVTGLI